MAAAARGRRREGGNGGGINCLNNGRGSEIGARGGGGFDGGRGGSTGSCGGGGGWSPSLIFLEQPLEREFTPFFLQMTARVCRGSLPLL